MRFKKLIISIFFAVSSSSGAYCDNSSVNLYPPLDFQKKMQIWLKQGLKIKEFDSWLYKPGSLFGSADIWWHTKTHYTRAYPHEGVDFYYYQSRESKELLHVPEGTPIPLIYDGLLKITFQDFIGLSLLFSTNQYQEIQGKKHQFYLLYSHVKSLKALNSKLNTLQKAGTILFTYNQQRKIFAPPHLHITTFWANEQFNPKEVSWDSIDSDPNIILINPLLTSPSFLEKKLT